MKDDFLFHILSKATLTGEGEKEATDVSRRLNPDIPKGGMTVWDSDGDPLIAGGVYTLNGDLVTIQSERFGCGNIADTYYRVNYLTVDHKERVEIVDQNGGSLFDGWTYKSKFKKVKVSL